MKKAQIHDSGATAGTPAMRSRLTEISSTVEPDQMGDVWVFPPLPGVESSSEFFIFTRMTDAGWRELYSARMVPANGRPAHQIIVEHGTLPIDRFPRFINGLQRRLGDHAEPRHVRVEGTREAWDRLVSELAREFDPPPDNG